MTTPNINIEDFLKTTSFSKPELYSLTSKYSSLLSPLSKSLEKLDRSRFRDLLSESFGIDDSLIMDRDADNFISYEEFIKGMNILLKAKQEEKIKFCFRVYDLNGDRYISKEEMFQLLKNCLVKGTEEDDDGVKDLVDIVMKKLDEDRDGRVSENDWTVSVSKDSLLLEAFGQCLPSNETKKKFLVYDDVDLKIWEEKYKVRAKHTKTVKTVSPVAAPTQGIADQKKAVKA